MRRLLYSLPILLLALASCAAQTRQSAASDAATAATPAPSPSPATPQEALLATLGREGWSLDKIANGFAYVSSVRGLRKMRIAGGAILWQNMQCTPVGATLTILSQRIYTACKPETLTVLRDDTGAVLRSTAVPMYGINRVEGAGDNTIAVEGWNDGAALRNTLVLLRRDSLRPVSRTRMDDATFLGVVGDRAYIDDWCCNGRADEYLPATIYSISLIDGSQSASVDLRPDPDKHPGRLQPLGQGENNYLRGTSLYVPVGDMLYRYDVTNLALPPQRLPNPTMAPGARVPQANAQGA